MFCTYPFYDQHNSQEITGCHLIKIHIFKKVLFRRQFETLPQFLFPLLLQVAFSSFPQVTFPIIKHVAALHSAQVPLQVNQYITLFKKLLILQI